jgi:hypothetical protein
MKKSITIIISMLFSIMLHQSSMADDTTPQWCQPFTAIGKLEKGKHTHVGNGSKFTFHFLVLSKAIVIPAGECESERIDGPTEVTEIQVKEDDSVLAKFVGKTIVVSGKLSNPTNAYDVRDAILYPPFKISVSK